MRHFRAKRMRQFAELFAITPRTRILDVGGSMSNWLLLRDACPRVTILNFARAGEEPRPGFEWVFADGCSLPFADGAFDIVFSNSVIEHVGGPEKQARFAAEAVRVGRRYWIQTPNRYFPIEPHLLTPAIHWLPASIQRTIVPRFSVWQWIERPSPDRREYFVRHYLDDIRLLDAAGLTKLFPGASILRERSLGLTKSLIAVSNPQS